MNSTTATALSILVALALTAHPLLAKTNYKKWLNEEIVWIISQSEREIFQNLKSDQEREEFTRRFWERRDPTLHTPRNEFREEHYRRYEYALRNFQEGMPGWRTDRGRIYIIHGPPAKEHFYTSSSRMNTDGRGDYRSRTPNTILWTYHANANAKYYRGEISLVFQPSVGLSRQSFVLGESKTAQDKADQISRQFGDAADQNWLEADVRYQLILAGPPGLINAKGAEIPTAGLGESTRYIEDLLRSPGDVLEERAGKFEERETAKKHMREAVATRLSFGSLPIDLSSRSFVQEDGNLRVLVQLNIPVSELLLSLGKEKSNQVTSHLEVYCALADQGGSLVDELIDSVEISLSKITASATGQLHYLNSFNVPAGNYILKAAVRSAAGEKLGYGDKAVRFTRDEDRLALTELLLTNRMTAGGGSGTHPGEGVVMGDARLLPNPTQEFAPTDTLILYFQILLPRGKDLPDSELSVGVNFIAGDQIVKRLEPRKIMERNSPLPGVINFATSVSLKEFAPGNYTLQVQALDHISKKFSIQRASFTIAHSE